MKYETKQFIIGAFMWFTIPIAIAFVIVSIICMIFFQCDFDECLESFFESDVSIYESIR